MLYLTGIILTFFLAVLLLGKKNKVFADRILVCWLFVIAIHLLLYYLRGKLIDFPFSFILGLELPLPLLHGPLLYFYTASMTAQLPGHKRRLWLHLMLPAFSLLLFAPFFLLPAAQKIAVYNNKGAGFEFQLLLNLIAIFFSGIIYVAVSSMLLVKHKKNIANQFSNTERINLNWLRYLVYGIGLIWVFVFVGKDEWIFGAVTIFVLLLGFFGIGQVGIFTHKHEPGNFPLEFVETSQQGFIPQDPSKSVNNLNEIDEANIIKPDISVDQDAAATKRKYLKSGLSEEQASFLHTALTQLMVDKKLFERSELTLVELASILSVHPNHLSQVINEKEGKNFYEYINGLRIEEFKRLVNLPENKKYTIIGLAYQCGFNSKSSFNRYFKNVTHLSPSEYIELISE